MQCIYMYRRRNCDDIKKLKERMTRLYTEKGYNADNLMKIMMPNDEEKTRVQASPLLNALFLLITKMADRSSPKTVLTF